jgi:predicted transglutaminase-like cysteine proteinase
MPLAGRAPPPLAFLEFCRRQPQDCGGDRAKVREALAALPAGSPWATRFASVRSPAPGAVFAPRSAGPTSEPVQLQGAAPMTPQLWAVIQRVNTEVNRAIVRRSDRATYGVEDRWATPLSSGRRYGDCEDYALEKRHRLIAAGVPAEALNIALATTRWGEAHAVLLVAAGGGEYVLDNLDAWILPWDQAPYRWRTRQVGGDPFAWAYAAAD